MNMYDHLESDSKKKKMMNTREDENKVGDYNPSLKNVCPKKIFYVKLMLDQKYFDCIKESNLVLNFNTKQIKVLLESYRHNLFELTKSRSSKYKLGVESNQILDRIKALNEFIQKKYSIDRSSFVFDPKFYPKRCKIDLPRLKERIERTGLEDTSLRKLAKEYGVSASLMHHVVRKTLGYTYRAVYPLNVKCVSQDKMNILLIFMLRHAILVEEASEFIYVDESSFNNHKRSKKRWVSKRKHTYCYDYGRIRSLNLIMAITKRGVLNYRLNRNTNTGHIFGEFIEELVKEVKAKQYYNDLYIKKRLVLILDNAKIHKTPEVQKILKDSGLKVLFLPPYSPKLNPIEWVFSQIKRRFYDLTFANQ